MLLKNVFNGILFGVFLVASSAVCAQTKKVSPFGSEFWCQDALTFCDEELKHRNYFSGVRLLLDTPIGIVIPIGGRNKLSNNTISTPKLNFGASSNLYGSMVGIEAQAFFLTTVTFDDGSPVSNITSGGGRSIESVFGYNLGFNFFDGSMSLSAGRLVFNSGEFDDSVDESVLFLNVVFISFQVGGFARAVSKFFKGVKE